LWLLWTLNLLPFHAIYFSMHVVKPWQLPLQVLMLEEARPRLLLRHLLLPQHLVVAKLRQLHLPLLMQHQRVSGDDCLLAFGDSCWMVFFALPSFAASFPF
jgi:hypothetical protein